MVKPAALPIALPFVILWVAAPAIARWVSLPPAVAAGRQLSSADAAMLRRIARRTWRFFEVLVSPADNALPPDNLQEEPQPVVAHRTSPTNIAMYLLSIVTARDLGWIGTLEMAEQGSVAAPVQAEKGQTGAAPSAPTHVTQFNE